jgi:hypothetical protein
MRCASRVIYGFGVHILAISFQHLSQLTNSAGNGRMTLANSLAQSCKAAVFAKRWLRR